MDLKVSGHEVLLCLDKKYCVEDESTVLVPVSKYRPLLDWITRFRPSGEYALAVISVRNCSWVAQRVSGIVIDVTLQSTKNPGLKLVQAVSLTDLPVVTVLPVYEVNSEKYVALVVNFQLAAKGVAGEAFSGVESKPGVVVMDQAAALAAIGVDTSAHLLQPLGNGDVTIGDENLPPVKLFKTTQYVTTEEFAAIQEGAKNLATPTFAVTFASLSDAAQSNDLKTVLCARLAANQK